MDYLSFIESELTKSAKTSLKYFGKVSGTVKPGDSNQVLTQADIAVGEQLVAAVKRVYPGHNIIDEEAGAFDNGSNFTWVIDPIEATSNFAAGLPQYGIMIGLLDADKPVAGGVILPAQDILYLAEKGKGATKNGKPINVTAETSLINTLVSFGIDGHQDDPERTRRECMMLAEIVLAVRNMRNSGCEAVDPMYVAEGRYGGRLNTTARIWDNVAPQVIAEEAGALWTSLDGSAIDYTDPLTKIDHNFDFCVASPALHGQLQAIIQKNLRAA